jgi:predicted TIM-barrel fold metal-dependent hydrolase
MANMIIDCQSHVFPRAYAEWLTHNRGPLTAVREGDAYLVDYGGVQQFRLNPEAYDPKKKLRDMDAAGVDMALLSVNMPGPERLAPELAVEGARIGNDYLANLGARHPGRFLGLASLPMQDVPAAIAELDRAIDDLELRGALLFSHINGKPVDAPEFEPFYAHAAARAVPLVLHPTVPTWGSVIQDYAMIPMLGLMVDTSIAMLRLILSGVMERHPTLQIVHPHVGGVLPYLMGRIEEQTEVKRRGREHIKASPRAYYRRVYLDIVSPSPLAMRYGYDFAGADRLLFGSDHPWVKLETLLECVNQLEIPDPDRAKILGLNAAKLFGVETTPKKGIRTQETDSA